MLLTLVIPWPSRERRGKYRWCYKCKNPLCELLVILVLYPCTMLIEVEASFDILFKAW